MTRERLTELARDWWRETAGYAQFSKTNVDSLTSLLERVAEETREAMIQELVNRTACSYPDWNQILDQYAFNVEGETRAEQREADARLIEEHCDHMDPATIAKAIREAKY